MGFGNDPVYVKSRCFETFPFPDEDTGLTPALRQRIATLAEQIDAHRKRQQAAHASLTLTGIYNVLDLLRQPADSRAWTAKDKAIHEQGLVGVLRELHDELDAAVLQAYGWADLTTGAGEPRSAEKSDLLSRLVALNAQRAGEEKTGLIRWLRPAFQHPAAAAPGQTAQSLSNQELLAPVVSGLQADLALIQAAPAGPSAASAPGSALPAWPTTLPAQVSAVAQLLAAAPQALPLPAIEAAFKGKGQWKKGLPRILETLEVLGRARREGAGKDWRGT